MFQQGSDDAYVGAVIVHQTHRRKGMGRALVQHIIRQHGHNNVILDAIPMYENLYANLGFVTCDTTLLVTFDLSVSIDRNLPGDVYAFTGASLADVMTYDQTLHPYGYRAYLEKELTDEASYCIYTKVILL